MTTIHVRAAGNPYRTEKTNMLGRYRAHLRRSPEVVDEVLAATAGKRSALLRLERQASECYRSILAGELEGRGLGVEHLGC